MGPNASPFILPEKMSTWPQDPPKRVGGVSNSADGGNHEDMWNENEDYTLCKQCDSLRKIKQCKDTSDSSLNACTKARSLVEGFLLAHVQQLQFVLGSKHARSFCSNQS